MVYLTKKGFCVRNKGRASPAGSYNNKRSGDPPTMSEKNFDPHMTLLSQARKGTLTEKNISDLLKKGADIDFSDQNGWTPLLYATYGNREDVVRLLLKKGADPNMQDLQGRTPLMFAILFRRKNIMKLLLEHKADILKQDCEGWTALDFSNQVLFKETFLLKEIKRQSKERIKKKLNIERVI